MDITVSIAIQRFLNHCRVAKTLSPHTLRAYKTDLAHAEARLDRNSTASSIGRDELRGYVGAMLRDEGLKEASVKRRMATVKQLFKWLEREEAIPVNPFHRLDMCIRLPRRLPRARHEAEQRDTHSARMMHFVVIALFVTGLAGQ